MEPPGVLIALPGDQGHLKIHQNIDGSPLVGVNKVTSIGADKDVLAQFQPVNGACYQSDMSRCDLNQGWIPSAQRMALQIPLHPDRMSGDDWQALRGVGPRLAEVIERNRQENGDFGRFESLERVKGVGPKRILQWNEFFKSF